MDEQLKLRLKQAITEIREREGMTNSQLAAECEVNLDVFNNFSRKGTNIKHENRPGLQRMLVKFGYGELAQELTGVKSKSTNSFSSFLSRNAQKHQAYSGIQGAYVGLRSNGFNDSIVTYKLNIEVQTEPVFACTTVHDMREYTINGDVHCLKNNFLLMGSVEDEAALHMFSLNKRVIFKSEVILFGLHLQTTLDGSSSLSVPAIFVRADGEKRASELYSAIKDEFEANSIIGALEELCSSGADNDQAIVTNIKAFQSCFDSRINSKLILRQLKDSTGKA